MKLFNIINESKSFILILLFTFTLVITSQSFATGVDSPDPTPEANLNELCKVQDLTTLNAANKEKCVGWCKIKTNWVAKCAKIGVENPVAGDGETLKARIIKALNSLDDIATGLKVPDSYNNVYSFKIKLDQSQRPTLFEHMKPKEPSTDAEAIDKTLVSDTMKEIILDGLGYSDLKADGTNNDDKLEKFFIDFRNKWLQLEAKGSITDSDKDFEPSAFKALASSNQGNHGPMHQIYNMLEDGQKVFSTDKYNSVINDSSEVATDLKNLRDAIVGFVKSAVVVTVPDKWDPNTDLEFSIKLGTLRASLETFLDGLDAATFDVTKKEDFDKIKHYLTPMDLYTSPNVTRGTAKTIAGFGLLVLSGGDFKYDLNPEKVEAAVVAAGAGGPVNVDTANFTDDEKNRQEYKIYAARLKAFEAGLKERFASGFNYGTPAEGSLLHKITELARNNSTQSAADNSYFNVLISADIGFNLAPGLPGDIGVPHKVGFVGGKWVVLIYANPTAPGFRVGQKTSIEFITEPPDAGNPPRFTVQAPSTYVSADFWGTAPNRANPHHHTFDALSGNGLEEGTNLFAQEKLLSNAIVRTASNGILHTATASDGSPLKLIKFRLMNTHNLRHRVNNQGNLRGMLWCLDYREHFVLDDTFGRDTDKVFADLTKLSPALGQLYAYNRFTSTINFWNEIIIAGNADVNLPADGPGARARHYLSTHVVDPSNALNNALNDVTFVLTSKFMQNPIPVAVLP